MERGREEGVTKEEGRKREWREEEGGGEGYTSSSHGLRLLSSRMSKPRISKH